MPGRGGEHVGDTLECALGAWSRAARGAGGLKTIHPPYILDRSAARDARGSAGPECALLVPLLWTVVCTGLLRLGHRPGGAGRERRAAPRRDGTGDVVRYSGRTGTRGRRRGPQLEHKTELSHVTSERKLHPPFVVRGTSRHSSQTPHDHNHSIMVSWTGHTSPRTQQPTRHPRGRPPRKHVGL